MQKEEKIKSKTDALSLLFTIVVYKRTHLPPRGTRSMCDTDKWLPRYPQFSRICVSDDFLLLSLLSTMQKPPSPSLGEMEVVER